MVGHTLNHMYFIVVSHFPRFCAYVTRYEDVIDVFDQAERESIESDLKAAKNTKSEHNAYKTEYKKWKVL